jgi:hypothetical protein
LGCGEFGGAEGVDVRVRQEDAAARFEAGDSVGQVRQFAEDMEVLKYCVNTKTCRGWGCGNILNIAVRQIVKMSHGIEGRMG